MSKYRHFDSVSQAVCLKQGLKTQVSAGLGEAYWER